MKIKELKGILEKNSLDFALFYTSDSANINPNLFYFSGYRGIGALIIPKKQDPFLAAPEMELQKAKQLPIKAYSMETLKNQRFFGPKKFRKFFREKKFFESIYKIIRKRNIKPKNIAIDYNNFTLNSNKYFRKQFKGAKTKDVSLDCLKLRQTKTSDEIQIIKKSCKYAGNILHKAISSFKEFKTESEAAAFLRYETNKLGLETAFDPIVASGSNASMPHHEPKGVKLKNGFCIIDFGVKHKGYCSDITRTIYLGDITKKESDIYNFLLNTQKNIIGNIKIKDNCGEIYENCSKGLKGYAKYFIHGLGHGVGVEIHEMPNLSLGSNDRIEENMAFTVEPGIYIPKKFGIRIEDTVLMRKNAEALTNITKDLLIV